MFDRKLSYVICGPTPTVAWEDWEYILNTSFKTVDVRVYIRIQPSSLEGVCISTNR
jgi:hypothetical protein